MTCDWSSLGSCDRGFAERKARRAEPSGSERANNICVANSAIKRTTHAEAGLLHDVRINLRSRDVLVPEQVL